LFINKPLAWQIKSSLCWHIDLTEPYSDACGKVDQVWVHEQHSEVKVHRIELFGTLQSYVVNVVLGYGFCIRVEAWRVKGVSY
jgi:hypothetical protein